MKNCLRPFSLLLAVAFAGALAGCSSNADTPGAANAENGAAKTFDPNEGTPPAGMGQDSAVADLHRNTSSRPTGEQADEHAGHNHDGKADH